MSDIDIQIVLYIVMYYLEKCLCIFFFYIIILIFLFKIINGGCVYKLDENIIYLIFIQILIIIKKNDSVECFWKTRNNKNN